MSAAEKYTVEGILERVRELPTLPSIVYELSNVINDPMSSTKEVEQIMEKDQSVTAKVLKLVNSAYYSIPGGVSSLSRAIAFLGFDTVNQLVLSSSVIETLNVKSEVFKVSDFWVHSMGVGIAAECIAKKVKYPMPSDAFTGGLIHDMGKVVLLTLEPDLFISVVELANKEDLSFIEAEQKLGMSSHVQVGAVLAEQWRLPMFLRSAIKHHHTLELERRVGSLTPDLHRLIDIVCLANLLVHALKFGNGGHQKVLNVKKDLMLRLSLDPQQDLKPLVQSIKQNLDKASDFIRILGGE